MKTTLAALAMSLVGALSLPARADRLAPFRVMVGAAGHLGHESTVDVRGFAGLLLSENGTPLAWRRFAALGVFGGTGSASVPDPRGLDGKVTAYRSFIGPELRLGAAWVEDRATRPVDLYLAVAPLRLFASSISDRLPERGEAWGLRVAAGVAVPRSWHYADQAFAPGSCEAGICGIGLFLLLLPNTLELSYERAASANRAGAVLGYTF